MTTEDQIALLNDQERNIVFDLAIGEANEVVQNRFGGDSIELTPLEVAVYDLAIGAESLGHWDTVRAAQGIMLKLNPKAYMVLLD